MEQLDDLIFVLSCARYIAFFSAQRNLNVMFDTTYQVSILEKYLSISKFFVVVHFCNIERIKNWSTGLWSYSPIVIIMFPFVA